MKSKSPNKKDLINSIIIVISVAVILATIFSFSGDFLNTDPVEVSISDLTQNYTDNNIKDINIKDTQIFFETLDGKQYYAVKEPGTNISDLNIDPSNVEIKVTDTTQNRFWMELGVSIIPIFIIFLFLVFMFKQASGGANSAFNFGKSKAKLFGDYSTKKKITFDNVAGVKEAKAELEEIVDFLKNPKKYSKMGAKIPRGVIMFGPPGTGKTLLARAVAGEANVPFFNISGSEFVEMFVGVGASRVRDLFSKAKKNAPCIIFIDEIDAVGRHRGSGMGGGHDEREQTLNQILVEMDGFDNETNVIVMAATNRPDILDPAILRPGRFDRRVHIDLPDIESREGILLVHSDGKPMAKDIDLTKIAKQTPGFSGADLESLMNEAAILSAREGKKIITMAELEKSIEKVLLGPEKKSSVLSKDETRITAYHEAGHAIVANLLKHCDPVHKISIVSRGRALGVTWYMPDQDLHLYSKSKFKDDLAALLGGRAAEAVKFEEVTTGASNDLERATEIATKMVTAYGMSDKLGLRVYGSGSGSLFMGKEISGHKDYSDKIASVIDDEVLSLVTEAYSKAIEILKKNTDKLELVATQLLEKENVSREEFEEIMKTVTKTKN